mgnify:CR=1 FL=1
MAQKICRGCLILWGGPGHHAPGYFLTTRRDPRGQKMKPKGKATPSSLRNWRGARKERVPTISKSDWLFPKNGVLPRRRGCGLFPKLTDFFFWPRIRFGASISDDGQFHPVWDYIILYVKRGGVAVGPLGPPIVSGPRCQTGCCLRRRRFAQKRQKDPVGS